MEKKLWWRPTKFKKEFIEELRIFFDKKPTKKDDYWNTVINELSTVQGFCYKIWICRDTFYQWLKDAENDNYIDKDKKDKIKLSDTYKKAKENQENIWLQNSLSWRYSSPFAIFLWKNVFGYKDKTENETTLNMQNIQIEIVKNENKDN